MSDYFQKASMQEKNEQNIYSVQRRKTTRILYPVKFSFKSEGERYCGPSYATHMKHT